MAAEEKHTEQALNNPRLACQATANLQIQPARQQPAARLVLTPRYARTLMGNLISGGSAARSGSLIVIHHSSNGWRRLAIALGCTLLGNVSAWAQTTWTGASNANWSNPNNWTAGVPASTPAANFDVIM